jgi:hypothetical protein
MDTTRLFSKYFAESSKKVVALFQNLKEFASDPKHLLIIIIGDIN